MKKETLTQKILEHLIEAAATTGYLFAAIAVSGYGASQKQIERKMWEMREGGRIKNKSDLQKFKKRQQSFYSLIHKLQKEGLIKKGANRKWVINPLGRKKYRNFLKQLIAKNYPKQKDKDSDLKIIIFDIPERERWKRDWLRQQLQLLDFKMVQKSVWAAKVKLPNEFMRDLRDLRLLHHVEIFAVTKTGSLRFLD